MDLSECIKRIPQLLIKRRDSYFEIENKLYKLINRRKIRKINFIASGTSLNAARVTKYFAKKFCDLKAEMFYPNEFINYYCELDSEALYIFISQGGSTKLVYNSLEHIKEKGFLNISITEKLNSPIANIADLAIEMGSDNEEYMYRTIGYSTTVATCMLIEMAIARYNETITNENVDFILNDLTNCSENLNLILEKTVKWYGNNKFSLMKRNKCILTGAGYLYETAKEADIKLMEMVPMLTRSFELEELIHGPQNAFDDNTIFFILTDRKNDLKKLLAIKDFIRNEIGYCVLVGDYKTEEKDMFFEYKSINFRMLEIITFFQYLAYFMATDHGRDLSKGVNAKINNYISKTL